MSREFLIAHAGVVLCLDTTPVQFKYVDNNICKAYKSLLFNVLPLHKGEPYESVEIHENYPTSTVSSRKRSQSFSTISKKSSMSSLSFTNNATVELHGLIHALGLNTIVPSSNRLALYAI